MSISIDGSKFTVGQKKASATQCSTQALFQKHGPSLQQHFAKPSVSRVVRGLVVTKAAATLEKPPVEPPLPDLPSMDQKIKVGINGGRNWSRVF